MKPPGAHFPLPGWTEAPQSAPAPLRGDTSALLPLLLILLIIIPLLGSNNNNNKINFIILLSHKEILLQPLCFPALRGVSGSWIGHCAPPLRMGFGSCERSAVER